MRIVFETHATSTDNEAGIATGWLSGRLSAQGRERLPAGAAAGGRRARGGLQLGPGAGGRDGDDRAQRQWGAFDWRPGWEYRRE